jgi:hypothetical protein
MRTHRLTTHLQAHEALTLIEFLDQIRAVLMNAYGDDITAMLRQAQVSTSSPEMGDWLEDTEPF